MVKACVINLDRSPDRRDHMVRQLSKTQLSYRFIRATDWRETDLDDPKLLDPEWMAEQTGQGMRPGSVGAALSHLDAYRKILADGADYGLVMEDDITLPADLAELVDAVQPHMTGAEVVLLNFHSILLGDRAPYQLVRGGSVLNVDLGPCQVSTAGSVDLPSSRSLVQIAESCFPSSGGCCLITRKACERRLQTGLPIRDYADEWPIFYWNGVIDRVRCVTPMPVINSPAFRTTIDHYRSGSVQARIREFVARARIPILYQALALRRTKTFRRLGWDGRFEFVDDVSATSPTTVYRRTEQRPMAFGKASVL